MSKARFEVGDLISTNYGIGLVTEVNLSYCLVDTRYGRLTLRPEDEACLLDRRKPPAREEDDAR